MEIWKILFGEDEIKPTSDRQWRKWEYRELIGDLYKAEEIISEFNLISSTNFYRVNNFQKTLILVIDRLEDGDHSDFSLLKEWFAPNSEWNLLTEAKSDFLRSKVYDRAIRLSEVKKEYSTAS